VIVVDANILFYLHVRGDQTQLAEKVYERDSDWFAPALWRSEFRNALALYLRRGKLNMERSLDAMQRAERLMQGRELDVASVVVLKLAADSGGFAYDCEYVSLAQDLGVPLVTADADLLSRFGTAAVSMQAFCSKK